MNNSVRDYIDGIVIPSDVMIKRINTGEKVKQICENIENAIRTVYGDDSIVYYKDLARATFDAEQIYYFCCVENTSTSGGYFACVYLYMEDDFMGSETYETKIEIMFSETEPDTGDGYDIWDDDETSIWINIGPEDFEVKYTPKNDPEHYPIMSGDIERIKRFVDLVSDK